MYFIINFLTPFKICLLPIKDLLKSVYILHSVREYKLIKLLGILFDLYAPVVQHAEQACITNVQVFFRIFTR